MERGTSAIGVKEIIRFVIFVFLLPVVLFIAAGRLDWVMGWVFVGLVIVMTVISRIIVARTNPDLLAERARSLEAENVKRWDKVLVPLIAIYGPLVTWIVAGLDERFSWSPKIPLAFYVAALVLVVLSYILGTWAMAANKFFSAFVRIQEERSHIVASSGPYRYVRHPGYAGAIVSSLATPLVLDSLWALIPSGLVVLLLIVRTALEDNTLHKELPGYAEYTRQTRYRLLPGVW
jgi:protein-S-isoprenylcysteine O-methyltransferase Ste14